MKTRNVRKKFPWYWRLWVSARLWHLRAIGKRWWPIPFIKEEHAERAVFEETLIANHPGSHDGVLFGVRFDAVKQIILHRLWRKRKRIGIRHFPSKEAGPNSGMWNVDTPYELHWIKPEHLKNAT